MYQKLIAGNWKMNQTREQARAFLKELATLESAANTEMLVCPPISLLTTMVDENDIKINLGVQDVAVAVKESGAFTGDISAKMVQELGASYAIVGHSERRAMHGETNEIVQQKAINAIDAGLKAIICVGETLNDRDAGNAVDVVLTQVLESMPKIATGDNCVIAYEPVWAIGTGKVPTVDDVAEMHAAIHQAVEKQFGANIANSMRYLYGGSVKPSNADSLLSIDYVDGALIGGASLKATDFNGIATAQYITSAKRINAFDIAHQR